MVIKAVEAAPPLHIAALAAGIPTTPAGPHECASASTRCDGGIDSSPGTFG
ncbi:hypothetical protein [Streptosporangium sp. NPDC050280]|uniref:hypothetical protein n=1 Tax=unclassified Streptosporangium TaxID=2632669 RepID=UPI00341A5661